MKRLTHTRLGDRAGAMVISDSLVALTQPFRRGDPTVWRAYIAAQLGDLDEAVELLEQADEEGWRIGLTFHRSPYLKPLRGYAPFERLAEPRG